MTSIDPIRDLRFEGMDLPQLREWINQIKQGAGTESMQTAVRALEECVRVVTDLDDTLRRELAKLQIDWEGNAGSLAAEATRQRSAVLGDAPDPLARSASGVEGHGEGYESTRHKLPNTDELRHQEAENFFEWAGGGFGYESDYDAEAKRIDAQKKAAAAALAGYRDTAVEHAEGYRRLPAMPAGAVQAIPPSGPVPSAGIGPMPTGADSGAAVGGFVGGVPGRNVPGGGNPNAATASGGRTSTPGADRTGAGRFSGGQHDPVASKPPEPSEEPNPTDAPRPAGEPKAPGEPETPGEAKTPGEPQLPGEPRGREEPQVPGEPKAPGEPAIPEESRPPEDPRSPEEHAAQLGERPDDDGIGTGTVLGLAAGGAALIGGGAYAAKRVLGGKSSSTSGGAKGAAPRTGASSAPGDVVAGKTPDSRPAAGSMLSAAATRGAKSDDEHDSDGAVEETPFDDERLVAPAVLGEQPDGADGDPESAGDIRDPDETDERD